MAIILVNLTFADADLRKELVASETGFEVVEALAFALRVASLTKEEYEARQPFIEDPNVYEEEAGSCVLAVGERGESPKQRLVNLMAADRRLRTTRLELDHGPQKRGSVKPVTQYVSPPQLADAKMQLFPESARWCLTALKNLTRPSKDSAAANTLVLSGIIPLILEYICISARRIGEEGKRQLPSQGAGGSLSSSELSAQLSDPLGHCVEFTNAPCTWDSNSMQDAALFVVLNLATNPTSRDYVKEADGISILTYITMYRTVHMHDDGISSSDDLLTSNERNQESFQFIKAVSNQRRIVERAKLLPRKHVPHVPFFPF